MEGQEYASRGITRKRVKTRPHTVVNAVANAVVNAIGGENPCLCPSPVTTKPTGTTRNHEAHLVNQDSKLSRNRYSVPNPRLDEAPKMPLKPTPIPSGLSTPFCLRYRSLNDQVGRKVYNVRFVVVM